MAAVVIELDPIGPLEMDSDGKFNNTFFLKFSNYVSIRESDERNRNVHTVPIASH